MIPLEALNEASRVCWEGGIRILQGFRLADTDWDHIDALLHYMHPSRGSHWIDIGCGFGEPAALMQAQRPDLRFELVNNNEFQLSQVPDHLSACHADMQELPFHDCAFDGAMFLYSICHAPGLIHTLQEARRVVRPGGRLFVFDYVRTRGNNDLALQHLGAQFFTAGEWEVALYVAGWGSHGYLRSVGGSDELFRSLFGDGQHGALYDRIFRELTPVVLSVDQ